jgi:hypothetical protein
MARRQKVLQKRLYHFDALRKRGDRPLYGGVHVNRSARIGECAVSIEYRSKRHEGLAFPIARVYQAADDATLFEVYGIGKRRNTDEMTRKKIALWKRYAHVFTPMPQGGRWYDGDRPYYLLCKDGSTRALSAKPGVWRGGQSSLARKSVEAWLSHNDDLSSYVLFKKRARRFVRRLVAELDGIPCRLALWHGSCITDSNKRYHPGLHLSLAVSTPPTSTQDGRTLGVEMYMYNRWAREHHHVDGDYGMKHCHYLACQRPDPGQWRSNGPLLLWKCGNDAIAGIKEWIIGDIYIPGPG